ncbi:YjfK family protein [Vibrio sp. S4M6]|uniref:DUF2491 family protein n=1 Tax=Vibrio sinus TaxID=2946865 RepID=UPI00202A5FC1|nr:DUF2491 family protein [Vibrio sinus]MCL9781713.1 YjfK family protein [Vibrio sinus]
MSSFFSKLFGREDKQTVDANSIKAPEILGLKLGGSFTINPLLLRTREAELTIEGAASTQIIQAVGEVNIDDQYKLLRYYTDDDGYLQVQMYGDDEAGIQEISMWYMFDCKSTPHWKETLESVVSKDRKYQLDGNDFEQCWPDEKPLLFTEKTYHEDGTTSETDQFCMSYTRPLSDNDQELLLVSAEEKLNKATNQFEHELVRSTGFQVNKVDITPN